MQCWRLKNHAEKDEIKKVEHFQLFWQILEEKNYHQSNLSKTWTNILKNGSRQCENRFSSTQGVNEYFSRNLIWQHQQQQQHQKVLANNSKISTNSHQKVFQKIYTKRPLLKSLFSIDSGLQPAALLKERLQNRCFPVKLLITLFFVVEYLQMTASGRAPDFTKNGPNSNSYWYFWSLLSKKSS